MIPELGHFSLILALLVAASLGEVLGRIGKQLRAKAFGELGISTQSGDEAAEHR